MCIRASSHFLPWKPRKDKNSPSDPPRLELCFCVHIMRPLQLACSESKSKNVVKMPEAISLEGLYEGKAAMHSLMKRRLDALPVCCQPLVLIKCPSEVDPSFDIGMHPTVWKKNTECAAEFFGHRIRGCSTIDIGSGCSFAHCALASAVCLSGMQLTWLTAKLIEPTAECTVRVKSI